MRNGTAGTAVDIPPWFDIEVNGETIKRIPTRPSDPTLEAYLEGLLLFTDVEVKSVDPHFAGYDRTWRVTFPTGTIDAPQLRVASGVAEVSTVSDGLGHAPVAIPDVMQVKRNSTDNELRFLRNDYDLDGDALTVVEIAASPVSPVPITIVESTQGKIDPSTNEVQEVRVEGAISFRLSYLNKWTELLTEASSSDDIKSKLQALDGIEAGDINVTGSGTDADPWTITFQGTLAAKDVPELVASVPVTNTDQNGKIFGLADGTFTYTPPADFEGVDSFDYRVRDTEGNDATATVYIAVDVELTEISGVDSVHSLASVEQAAGSSNNDIFIGSGELNNGYVFLDNWGHDVVFTDNIADTLDFSRVTTPVTIDSLGPQITKFSTIGRNGMENTVTVLGSFGAIKKDLKTSVFSIGSKLQGLFSSTPVALTAPGDGLATSADSEVLTRDQLTAIVDEAVGRWESSPLGQASPLSLDGVEFRIVDLPDGILGKAFEHGVVYLDATAAGTGWFVDPTPTDDSEFPVTLDGGALAADADSPAAGRLDLLTVTLHELGHLLGLPDVGTGDDAQLMYATLEAGLRKALPDWDPSQPVPASAVVGLLTATEQRNDEKSLVTGLEKFADWAEGFDEEAARLAADGGALPFVNQALTAIWNIDGVDVPQAIRTQVQEPLMALFSPGKIVSSEEILALPGISQPDPTNPRAFQAELTLQHFRENVDLDFEIFGGLGLSAPRGANPLILEGGLTFTFDFGLDFGGSFFVEDPNLTGDISVSHNGDLDVSLYLGPLAIGVRDGRIHYNAEVQVGMDGTMNFDQFSDENSGGFLGVPQLGGKSGYDIYLPIELQGILAGLPGETALLQASFNPDYDPDQAPTTAGLADLFTSIPQNLKATNFDKLLSFQTVSLDMLLDGFSVVLAELASDEGAGGKKLPLINKSVLEIVGGGEEIQTITVVPGVESSGGTFTLKFDPGDGSTVVPTEPIPFDAVAATIESELEALPALDDVTVTGEAGGPWTVTFTSKVKANVLPLIADVTQLVNADVEIETEEEGGNAIQQLQAFVDRIRANLSDIKSLERDLNFAISSALGLDLGTSADAVGDAFRGLLEVSSKLNADSTNDDIAIALAEWLHRDDFEQLQADRDLIAAVQVLTELGLDAESTEADLAASVVEPETFQAIQNVAAAVAAADASFLSGWQLLRRYGLPVTSTDEDIDARFESEEGGRVNFARLAIAYLHPVSATPSNTTVVAKNTLAGAVTAASVVGSGVSITPVAGTDLTPARTEINISAPVASGTYLLLYPSDGPGARAADPLAVWFANSPDDVAPTFSVGNAIGVRVELDGLTDSAEIASALAERINAIPTPNTDSTERRVAMSFLAAHGLADVTDPEDPAVDAAMNAAQLRGQLQAAVAQLALFPTLVEQASQLERLALGPDGTDDQIYLALADPLDLAALRVLQGQLLAAGDSADESLERLASYGLDATSSDGDLALALIGPQETDGITPSAATVEQALENLRGIDDVVVTATDDAKGPWTVEFVGPGGQPVVPLTTSTAGYHVTVVEPGRKAIDEVQTVSHSATAGTFQLGFDGDSNGELTEAEKTSALAYNASAEQLEAALEALGGINDVVVYGVAGGPWRIEFVDPGGMDVDRLTPFATMLTPADSLTVTTLVHGAGPVNAVQRIELTGAASPFSLVFDPAGYADRIADRDTMAMYEANKVVSMAYANSTFTMDVNLEKRVQTELEFEFDLQDLIQQDPTAAELFGEGGLFQVTAEGAGSLAIDAFAAFDLGFGFDLSNIFSPKFFVSDKTGITLGLDATAGTVVRDFFPSPEVIDVERDTIWLPENKYQVGDKVLYEAVGDSTGAIGILIGGVPATLTSGQEYYLKPLVTDPHRIRLYATPADLEAGMPINLTDVGSTPHRFSIGRPLEFKAGIDVPIIGEVGLAVKNATAALSLRAHAGLAPEPEDGRYTLGFSIGEGLQVETPVFDLSLRGTAVADLPLYFPTEDFPLGGFETDNDGNGYADNVLHLGAGFQLSATDEKAFQLIDPQIVAPNLKNAFNLFALLNDPENIVKGLDGFFDGLKVAFSDVLNPLNLPVIGDALKDASGFVDDLRESVLGRLQDPTQPFDADMNPYVVQLKDPTQDFNAFTNPYIRGIGPRLSEAAADGKTTIEIVQEELFLAMGDILVTQVYDPTVRLTSSVPLISSEALADLKMRLASSDSTTREAAELELRQKSKQIQLTLGSDFIQFNMLIGDNIFRQEIPLDFMAAVPALGLEITSNTKVVLNMDYLFGFGFGFSVKDLFYVDTTGVSPTGEEFSIDISATLAGDGTDPAAITASLGFAGLSLSDVPNDGLPSGLFGSLDVDLKSSTGRLGLKNLSSVALEARLSAFADVDLKGRVNVGPPGQSQFPSIFTTLHYDQLFADVRLSTTGGFNATFGNPPVIWLENVSLDLGTFISDFAAPILAHVQQATKPLAPVIKVLTDPIPVISDLAGKPTTFLDLAAALAGDKFNRGFIDAVIAVIKVINSIPTNAESILISFGDFYISDGSGNNDLRNPNKKLSDTKTDVSADKEFFKKQLQAPTGVGPDDDDGKKQKGASQKTKGFLRDFNALDGLEIPLLNDPTAIFGLLTGKPTDLFIYNLPPLIMDFEFVKAFPVPSIPPLNIRLGGRVNLVVDMGFGFDTYGFVKFQDGGYRPEDIPLIFDGLYIRDTKNKIDIHELDLEIKIFAGASLGVGGIAEVGAQGGIFTGTGFNLHDIPDPETRLVDNKIRVGELAQRLALGPPCIFDVFGDIGAFLEAFVQIKAGPITLLDESFELFRVTIADFAIVCTPGEPPVFADMGDWAADNGETVDAELGTLYLNMGDRREERKNGDLNDYFYDEDSGRLIGERFEVRYVEDNKSGMLFDADGLVKDAEGNTVFCTDEAPCEGYQVFFNGGPDEVLDPDDTLNKERRLDRIFVKWAPDKPKGVQKIVARGGQGNDTILINANVDADLDLEGGDDDDHIEVRDSDREDRVVVIRGGDGDDLLVGGNSDDLIEGGLGNDTIRGNTGNDRLFGGTESDGNDSGDDRIEGGEGDDLIYGGSEPVTTEWVTVTNDDGTERTVLVRTAGGDTITGGPGNDSLFGEGGDDTLKGDGDLNGGEVDDRETGDDWIDGGPDNDTLFGFGGNDVLLGGDGDDTLNGGAGQDVALGQSGNDSVRWIQGDGQDFHMSGGDQSAASGSQAGVAGDSLFIQSEEYVTSSLTAEDLQDVEEPPVTAEYIRLETKNLPAFPAGTFTDPRTGATITINAAPGLVAKIWNISIDTDIARDTDLSLDATGFENVTVNSGDGADTIEVYDLKGTDVANITLDTGKESGTVNQFTRGTDADGNPLYWLMQAGVEVVTVQDGSDESLRKRRAANEPRPQTLRKGTHSSIEPGRTIVAMVPRFAENLEIVLSGGGLTQSFSAKITAIDPVQGTITLDKSSPQTADGLRWTILDTTGREESSDPDAFISRLVALGRGASIKADMSVDLPPVPDLSGITAGQTILLTSPDSGQQFRREIESADDAAKTLTLKSPLPEAFPELSWEILDSAPSYFPNGVAMFYTTGEEVLDDNGNPALHKVGTGRHYLGNEPVLDADGNVTNYQGEEPALALGGERMVDVNGVPLTDLAVTLSGSGAATGVLGTRITLGTDTLDLSGVLTDGTYIISLTDPATGQVHFGTVVGKQEGEPGGEASEALDSVTVSLPVGADLSGLDWEIGTKGAPLTYPAPQHGLSASTDAGGTVVTLGDSATLTEDHEDGLHVLYLTNRTTGERQVRIIQVVDVDNHTVTVDATNPLAPDGTNLSWAIGHHLRGSDGALRYHNSGEEVLHLPGEPVLDGDNEPVPYEASNEIQHISTNGTGGTFTLVLLDENSGDDPVATQPIAWNATAADVEAKLETLPNVVDVRVTAYQTGEEAPRLGTHGNPWVVEFINPGNVDQGALVADGAPDIDENGLPVPDTGGLNQVPFVDENGDPLVDGDGRALFYAVGEEVLDSNGNPVLRDGGELKSYLGREFVYDDEGFPTTYQGGEPRMALGGERIYDLVDGKGQPAVDGKGIPLVYPAALQGTAARSDAAGKVITLDGTADLSWIPADNSVLIYLTDRVTGQRQIARISSANQANHSVTLNSAIALDNADPIFTWAVGHQLRGTDGQLLTHEADEYVLHLPGEPALSESGNQLTYISRGGNTASADSTGKVITLPATANVNGILTDGSYVILLGEGRSIQVAVIKDVDPLANTVTVQSPVVGSNLKWRIGSPLLRRADEPMFDQSGNRRFNGTGLARTDEYGNTLVLLDAQGNVVRDANGNVQPAPILVGQKVPAAGNDLKPDTIIIHGGQQDNIFGDNTNLADTFTLTTTVSEGRAFDIGGSLEELDDMISQLNNGIIPTEFVDKFESCGTAVDCAKWPTPATGMPIPPLTSKASVDVINTETGFEEWLIRDYPHKYVVRHESGLLKVFLFDGTLDIDRGGYQRITVANTLRHDDDPRLRGSLLEYHGDVVRILGHEGDDEINATAVRYDLASLLLVGETGNDTLVGSPFDDILDSGLGDDTVTGDAGVDRFFDAGGDDTLKEQFDKDQSLFGDTYVVGTLLSDDGSGPMTKRNIKQEEAANEAARTREAFITLRRSDATPEEPEVSLSAPSGANSESTVVPHGNQVEIHLIGDVKAGQLWELTIEGKPYEYTVGDNGDPLTMETVAKRLSDQVNDNAESTILAEDHGPEPIIHSLTDRGDVYGATAEVESLVDLTSGLEIFENAILDGGDSANVLVVGVADNRIKVGGVTRTVSNWKGAVDLNAGGRSGSDNEYYLIYLKGEGARYSINDTGQTDQDEIYVIGTDRVDQFTLDTFGGRGRVSSGDFYDANFPYRVETSSSDIVTNRNNVTTDVRIVADASLLTAANLPIVELDGQPQAVSGPISVPNSSDVYVAFTISADDPASGTVEEDQVWSVTIPGLETYYYTTVKGDTDASVAAQLQRLIRGDNPAREEVTFRAAVEGPGVERLFVRTLGGADVIQSNDTAVVTVIEMGNGNDRITVGQVPTVPDRGNGNLEFPAGIPIADVNHLTNGNSAPMYVYGGLGNDNFEVNHNVAELFLFGEEGNDRFVINTFLVLNDDPDDPSSITNLSRMFGGLGDNRYEYLQNAPVNIFGGPGTDTVVFNGTPIGDDIVITGKFVAGAGRIVPFVGIEILEVNGAGGGDRIYVLGVPPHIQLTVNGGTGSDEIHLGGDHPTLFFDPPEFIYNPPAYEVQGEPELRYNTKKTDPLPVNLRLKLWADPALYLSSKYGTFVGDFVTEYVTASVTHWYESERKKHRYFDLQYFNAATGSSGLDGLLQDTYASTTYFDSYWGGQAWQIFDPYIDIHFEIPPVNFVIGTEVLPEPRVVTPPAVRVDPDPFALKVDAVHRLDGIRGLVRVEGGEDTFADNDTLFVHSKDAQQALEGTLVTVEKTIEDVDVTYVNLTGLGLRNGSISWDETDPEGNSVVKSLDFNGSWIRDVENIDIRFGTKIDTFVVNAHDPDGNPVNVQLVLNDGDDTVTVKQAPGEVRILGGKGSDTVHVAEAPNDPDDVRETDAILGNVHFDASGHIVELAIAIPYDANHDATIQGVSTVFINTDVDGLAPQDKEKILTASRTAHVTFMHNLVADPLLSASTTGPGSSAALITRLNQNLVPYWTAADVTLTGSVAANEEWVLKLNGMRYAYTAQSGNSLQEVAEGLLALVQADTAAADFHIEIDVASPETLRVSRNSGQPFRVEILKGLFVPGTISGTLFEHFFQFELRGQVQAGQVWEIQIDRDPDSVKETYSVTATADDTLQTIAQTLRDQIDAQPDYSAQVEQYLDLYAVDVSPISGLPIKDEVHRRGVQALGYQETGFRLRGYERKDVNGNPVLDSVGKPIVVIDQNNTSGEAVDLFIRASNSTLTTTDTGWQAIWITQTNETFVRLYENGGQITTQRSDDRVADLAAGSGNPTLPVYYDPNGNLALLEPAEEVGFQRRGYQQYGYFQHTDANGNVVKSSTKIDLDAQIVLDFDDLHSVPLYWETTTESGVISTDNDEFPRTVETVALTTETSQGSWPYVRYNDAAGVADQVVANRSLPLYRDGNNNLTIVNTGVPDPWRRGFQRTDAAGQPLYLTEVGTLTTIVAVAYQQVVVVTNQPLYRDERHEAVDRQLTNDRLDNPQAIYSLTPEQVAELQQRNKLPTGLGPLYRDRAGQLTTRSIIRP